MISQGRWPGNPGRKKKQLTFLKTKHQKLSGQINSNSIAGPTPVTNAPAATELSALQQPQYQRIIVDEDTAQGSAPSLSALVVGALLPGLHVRGGASGAGQGHGHAPEDHHHQHPNDYSPSDDQNLFCAAPRLGHDNCFAAVSI